MLRDKLLIIIIAILMTLTLSTGCSNQNKGDKNAKKIKKVKIEKTPAEKEQAELLRKVSRDFEDADAHYRLGYLHQQNGLWAKAQYEYSTALNFDPINRQAQAGLVKVLTNMGDTAKSQVYADIYMNQAASNASGSLKLALAFQQQKLDDYALRCYQNSLRLAPNSARINRQIGFYYLSKGDNVRAQEYLKRSFQLDPRQPDVSGALGRLGVAVEIPKKQARNAKKLDKIIDNADKKASR